MQDPTNELPLATSSPTASSISSSDLDTESTGSFFHDRSTSLGFLMGVSLPAITFRAESQQRDPNPQAVAPGGSGTSRKSQKKKMKKKAPLPSAAAVVAERRRWWRLCRDDDARTASLGEFLEIERRFGDGAFFDGSPAAELQGSVPVHPGNGRVLFADGRVLPPQAQPGDADEGTPDSAALCRFPVSLTGICSGGTG